MKNEKQTNQEAWNNYQEIKKQAWETYREIECNAQYIAENSLASEEFYDENEEPRYAKTRRQAQEKCDEIVMAASEAYQKTVSRAWRDYEKSRQHLRV